MTHVEMLLAHVGRSGLRPFFVLSRFPPFAAQDWKSSFRVQSRLPIMSWQSCLGSPALEPCPGSLGCLFLGILSGPSYPGCRVLAVLS